MVIGQKDMTSMINPLKSVIQISLTILLICSVVQILPMETPIITNVSGGSSWTESDWNFSANYSSSYQLDTVSKPGSIQLEFTKGIYVTDLYNHRIIRTNMDGSEWTTFGAIGSGIGKFNKPSGIHYDSRSGYLFVVDMMNHRIVQMRMGGGNWTTYGTQGSGRGQFFRPYDISYDNNTGFFYVADTFNDRIIKTKMNGSGWKKYGTEGPGIGQFKLQCGIYFDNASNYIYVGDSHNNRIVKTLINGYGWTAYGIEGPGTGQFDGTCGISYDDSTGYIYVVDTWNNRIVRTRMDGSGWISYGSYGSGKGQFDDPSGIYYDKDTGFIYVADSGNHRIVKTRIDGAGWTTLGVLGNGTAQFNYPAYIALCNKDYYSEGYLISRYYHFDSSSTFKKLTWAATTPVGTSIRFQLRTAESSLGLPQQDFVGPDGSNKTYYRTSGTAIWPGHNNQSWLQYKVYLSTIDHAKTPVLDDVTVIYNLLPDPPILITPQNNTFLNEPTPTFTWNFSDADSLYQGGFQWQVDDDYEFNSVDHDSGLVISGISSHTPKTIISDGNWYWWIRTKDTDHDWSMFSKKWAVTIDTISPISNVIFPSNNEYYNQLHTIKGEAMDPSNGTGISKVEIIIKRMSDYSYWSGSGWSRKEHWLPVSGRTNWEYDSSTVKWNSGDRYFIQSRAVDNTTNVEIPNFGIMIYIDMDRPSSNIDYPLNNTYLNSLTTIFGSAVDTGGAGINRVEICIMRTSDNACWNGEHWNSVEAWVTAEGTRQWSLNSTEVSWTSDDYYNIRSRALDVLGNIEVPGVGITFMYDNLPPQASISINNDAKFTRFLNVTLSLDSVDTGSGVALMCFSSDNIEWTVWELFNKSKAFNLALEDGDKRIYFKTIDNAGNIAIPIFDSIVLDTLPPEDLVLLINDGGRFTNTEEITLSLFAMDRLSGLRDMSFSNDKILWTTWEPFASKRAFTLPPMDGEKLIYFRVRDRAGNSAKKLGSVILDTTPPHSLSIIINNGAPITNSTSVSLDLYAADNLSGVHEMSFITDGGSWDKWLPFSHERYFTLANYDGEKTVYFRVMDRAGNVADPVEGKIILNTSMPKEAQPIETSVNYDNWYILVFILIIILIFIAFIAKRKKPDTQRFPPPNLETVKPVPQISLDQDNLTPTSIPQVIESQINDDTPHQRSEPTPNTLLSPNITIQTTQPLLSPKIAQVQQTSTPETRELNSPEKTIFPPNASWAPNSPRILIG